MIGVLGSKPHTTAIVKPESTPRRLLLWDLQTLLPPDTSHLGGSRLSPTAIAHHAGNKSVAVPAMVA